MLPKERERPNANESHVLHTAGVAAASAAASAAACSGEPGDAPCERAPTINHSNARTIWPSASGVSAARIFCGRSLACVESCWPRTKPPPTPTSIHQGYFFAAASSAGRAAARLAASFSSSLARKRRSACGSDRRCQLTCALRQVGRNWGAHGGGERWEAGTSLSNATS